MAAINSFSLLELGNSLVSLLVAFVLGTAIGAERQYRQRSAGLRTTVLVAVGAAAFVDIGMRLGQHAGAIQLIAYVISGVGFLGAGVIMKDGTNIRGLNTAATLWGSAAVGACAGADLVGEAVLVTIAVLAGNTLLRPLVDKINRSPLHAGATEATYEVRVTTGAAYLPDVRELLTETLEAANYPVREIEIFERGEDQVELAATLAGSMVVPGELDAITTSLDGSAKVVHATWSARTLD